MGVVIFHSPCYDGTTAAWVASKFNPKRDDEYVPATYGDTPPDVTGKDVLIVDFSYPRDVMEDMNAKAKSMVVLDHHKSAQSNCEGLGFCHFDMNRSGAGLAWDFLFAGKQRPPLVNYVEDRDLWRFSLPDSRAVNAYISSFEKDFDLWNALSDLLETDFHNCVRLGRAIQAYEAQKVKEMAAEAHHMIISPPYKSVVYETLVCNCPYQFASQVGEYLYTQRPELPFVATYFTRADGLEQWSLRSHKNGADVSEIATQFGGGGHQHAAGFVKGKVTR